MPPPGCLVLNSCLRLGRIALPALGHLRCSTPTGWNGIAGRSLGLSTQEYAGLNAAAMALSCGISHSAHRSAAVRAVRFFGKRYGVRWL